MYGIRNFPPSSQLTFQARQNNTQTKHTRTGKVLGGIAGVGIGEALNYFVTPRVLSRVPVTKDYGKFILEGHKLVKEAYKAGLTPLNLLRRKIGPKSPELQPLMEKFINFSLKATFIKRTALIIGGAVAATVSLVSIITGVKLGSKIQEKIQNR